MKIGNSFSLLALILSLYLTACAGVAVKPDTTSQSNAPTASNSVAAESVTQNSPVETQKAESAERVVVLSSISADIVRELDSSKLVGVPSSRLIENNPKFAGIERVGLGQNPNLEAIIQLQPDLAIGSAGMQDATLQKLEELGIRTIAYDMNSWQALENLTEQIAGAIAADPTALLARYQTFIADIVPGDRSVLLLASAKPILSPNKNSWAGDLLANFKGKNVAADWQGNSPFSGYITLSAEKILEANPDEILLVATPGQENPLEQFEALPFWQKLKAVQSDRVYVFDYYGLVNPGSIDKISQASQQLRGALSEE